MKRNLIGAKFGRWTVYQEVDKDKWSKRCFLCTCECGTIKKVSISNLLSGRTNSCGCYDMEVKVKHNYAAKNGVRAPEYGCWMNMKSRCFNENFEGYEIYGGRGITVCDEWKDSFEEFIKYMGDKPTIKHTIERIDNNGNYEPGNCRWATRKEQARNRRDNVHIEYKGVSLLKIEWCDILGISFDSFFGKMKRCGSGATTIEYYLNKKKIKTNDLHIFR